MRSDLVVAAQPIFGDFARVDERLEEVCVEHFATEAAIEAFDERVLVGFAGLDVEDLDAFAATPIGEGLAQELRSVVAADRTGLAIELDELLEHANDARRGVGSWRSQCPSRRGRLRRSH